MFNEQLARDALKRLKENPQEWNQKSWRCQSGMCFAGFVAFEAGARWANPEMLNDDMVVTPDGNTTPVWMYAEDALGIPRTDPHMMWDSQNTIDDLNFWIDRFSK